MASKLVLDNDFDSLGGSTYNAVADPHGAAAGAAAALQSSGAAPAIDAPEDCHTRLAQGVQDGDEWRRDAEVRELTGEDEEALARIKGSSLRFMDALILRATVHIGGVEVTRAVTDELLIGDREALIVAIRVATFGGTLDIDDYVCPGCQEHMGFEIDLRALPTVELDEPGTALTVELRRGRTAVIRYPTGADQFAVYDDPDATRAAQNSILLARCLESIDGVPMPPSPISRAGVVKKLGMADRLKLLRELSDNQPGPRLDRIEYVHEACGTVIKLPLSVGDLFLGV